MKRFKLANVLLRSEDFLAESTGLLYRLEPGSTMEPADEGVRLSGQADFGTYFNAVSVEKWRRYAHLVSVRLHLETAGDECELATYAASARDTESHLRIEEGTTHLYSASEEFRTHEVDIPIKDAAVAGFTVKTEGSVRIRNAYYYTLVHEDQVHPVRLAVCTTTFRKEEFIVPNIERIKREVLGSEDEIAGNFHLFVVDNGQTLDAEGLTDAGVSVIPNINAGGAGGFARGMMAAQEYPEDFTHVVLMDDDVRMSTESFKRLYALLSLLAPEYARSCVNGAMLELENPGLQFEDVSRVRWIGGYESIKPKLEVERLDALVHNEMFDVEVENAYGAWWFSCIPMSYIDEMGLPMPFFVRCDDVEYGLRMKATYLTMNGICVWHSRFSGRYNAAVVCYLYTRNMLATMALHPRSNRALFMLSYRRVFDLFMRTMDYGSAELWLRGMEDYLKGPIYLMSNDGFELMSKAGQVAEKYVDVDELDPAVMGKLKFETKWLSPPEKEPSALRKAITTIPHDRHWLPDFLLGSGPEAIAPGAGEGSTPWYRLACKKMLVALNPDATKGQVRRMDRARHKELARRYRDLMREYRNSHEAVDEEWRKNMREMTSHDFWRRYLRMG